MPKTSTHRKQLTGQEATDHLANLERLANAYEAKQAKRAKELGFEIIDRTPEGYGN